MVCKLSTWVEPDSFGNLKFSHDEKLYPARKGSVIWNGSASGVNTRKFNIINKESWRKEIRSKYGDETIMKWSIYFVKKYGKGYSFRNLFNMKKFYQCFKITYSNFAIANPLIYS